jgi:hypothetical protein
MFLTGIPHKISFSFSYTTVCCAKVGRESISFIKGDVKKDVHVELLRNGDF